MSVTTLPGSRTIERALGVLDAFTPAEYQWRTTDLAHRCGLPVPTTHRILRTLDRFGYVTRDPASGAYRLGPSAASLAHEEPLVGALRDACTPVLAALHRATGERISLAALPASRDHGREICAVGETGTEDAEAGPCAPRPLHAGASSKILLARLSGEELARVLERGLRPVGPATITRPARLRREVIAIRRRGWAFSSEEVAAGIWELAVPVAADEHRVCAVGVSAPLARFDRERARKHLSVLKLAADAMAERLEAGEPVPAGALRETQRGEPRWQTATA
jgi:IclR family acetate operon transcriptional repressor